MANLQRMLDNAVQGATRGVSLTQRRLAFSRQQELSRVLVDAHQLKLALSNLSVSAREALPDLKRSGSPKTS